MSRRRIMRTAAVLVIPAALLALAAAIDRPAWSATLYLSVVVSLVVIVLENLRDLDRHHGAGPAGDSTSPNSELNHRRLLELFAYVGDTTPTLVELSRAGTHALDGWFDLVSERIAHACGSAHAGLMVLREAVVLDSGLFSPRYEVVHSGGSRQCTLSVGVHVRVPHEIGQALEDEAGASSVYLASFTVVQDRFWVAILLSSSVDHAELHPLASMLVAPVATTLDAGPAEEREGGSDLETARRIERLNPRKGS